MYYLTPTFQIRAIVPPYREAGDGMERDATGKVFDRSTLFITRAQAFEAGMARCNVQQRRIVEMQNALDHRTANLAKTRSAT